MILLQEINAQPGGGGGLGISQIYDKDYRPIELTDTNLIIRKFVLNKFSDVWEYFPYSRYPTQMPCGTHQWCDLEFDRDRVPFPRLQCYFTGDKLDEFPDHRLLIIYKSDTMIIDFHSLMDENPMGANEWIDSVVIMEGYFLSQHEKEMGHFWQRFGITPTNYPKSNRNKLKLDFLKEENISAAGLISRAYYHFDIGDTTTIEEDLFRALKKRTDKHEKYAAYSLLKDFYLKYHYYENALKFQSILINIEKCSYQYVVRIPIRTQLKDYNNALLDFDTIIKLEPVYPEYYVKKAKYRIKYLQQYKEAYTDMHLILDTISENKLQSCRSIDQYIINSYEALAQAEYFLKNPKKAFNYFLIAEELNSINIYGGGFDDGRYEDYDSLIKNNSNSAELYLCRAISNIRKASHDYTQKKDQPQLIDSANNDLQIAKEKGLDEYRYYKYKGIANYIAEKYTEAVENLSLAINLEDTDARLHTYRYYSRQKIEHFLSYETDPDIIRAEELCKY